MRLRFSGTYLEAWLNADGRMLRIHRQFALSRGCKRKTVDWVKNETIGIVQDPLLSRCDLGECRTGMIDQDCERA